MKELLKYFTKNQGEYTSQDYFNLPPDLSVELVDGFMLDRVPMPKEHLRCAEYFSSIFETHKRELKDYASKPFIGCELYLDDKTVVTPDLFCCPACTFYDTHTVGIPTFVLEILSQETIVRDSLYKLHKYREVGVKEYWMIDLANERIYIHNFIAGIYMIKGFDEIHAIKAFDKQCDVDFYEMLEYMKKVGKTFDPYSDLNLYGFKESAIPYFAQNTRRYNSDDCDVFPDVIKVELMNGFIYDLASPSTLHQIILGHLMFKINMHIKGNKGKCVPFFAPLSVQLNGDNENKPEPDLFVVCNKDKIKKNYIDGAPDFVVEILSPSSIIKDQVDKLNNYRNHGVRLYWIVDPFKECVHIWNFEKDTYESKTFEDSAEIPVLDIPCIIDFKEMAEEISFLK